MEQKTYTSQGCPYSCPFCFNGKNDFQEYVLPQIETNNVILLDDAFLSRRNVYKDIQVLGSKIIAGKVVNYELLQGINLIDLNPEIAQALKDNRFKNIRFAWDDSYTKKSYYKVLDGIKMLTNAGYKQKDLICYILSNYYVSLKECLLKGKLMLYNHIPICNCVYRKNYLDPKIYPKHWSNDEIEYFKEFCRENNQIIKFNGFDPEIEKRLIRAKTFPLHKIKKRLYNII